jgi:nucleotide-binding universal stress UspA family protein
MSIFPTKILLATDGSEEGELAARTAADLAEKTSSELHVVHVYGIAPVGPPVYPEATDLQSEEHEAETEKIQRTSEQRARQVLEAELEKVRSAGTMVAQAHLIEGRVAPEIVALAEEIGAGLIVMGSRGHGGIRRALIGSVSDSVVRHAHCPTLVVREEQLTFPSTILLAVDGSEEARLAASTAADLAEGTDSELQVVTVGPFVPTMFAATEEEPARLAREARRTLDEQMEAIEAAGGRVAQTHLRLGGAAEEIVALAEDVGAGLIAMGSRGRGGIRRALMGSVSERVLHHAHCAVMIVRR